MKIKRVLALALSMVLAVAAFAMPVGAAAPKFYIPTKVTESSKQRDFNGAVEKTDTETYNWQYDAGNKMLTINNSDGAFGAELPWSAMKFLQNESTDTLTNRFVCNAFTDVATDAPCYRYFCNDLIRFGKIKKIICKYKGTRVGECDFTTKNNRVTSFESKFSDDLSNPALLTETSEDHYEYNADGNISKITNVFSQHEINEGELEGNICKLIAKFKYDSKERLSQINVSSPPMEDGDTGTSYIVKFADFSKLGIPQKETYYYQDEESSSSTTDLYHYYFDSQSKTSKIVNTEVGGEENSDYITTYSYNSKGYLSKVTYATDDVYSYSGFERI